MQYKRNQKIYSLNIKGFNGIAKLENHDCQNTQISNPDVLFLINHAKCMKICDKLPNWAGSAGKGVFLPALQLRGYDEVGW